MTRRVGRLALWALAVSLGGCDHGLNLAGYGDNDALPAVEDGGIDRIDVPDGGGDGPDVRPDADAAGESVLDDVALEDAAGDEAVPDVVEADAPCLPNLAARLESNAGGGFVWQLRGADSPVFSDGDSVVLRFAILPFWGEATALGPIWTIGSEMCSLWFRDGVVGEVLPYDTAGWNVVELEIRFGDGASGLTVNGVAADLADCPMASGTDDRTVSTLQIAGGDGSGPTAALLDGVSLSRRSTAGSERYFHENFQSSPEYTASPGARIVIVEPRIPLDDPIGCE